jgi:hypothetical protein
MPPDPSQYRTGNLGPGSRAVQGTNITINETINTIDPVELIKALTDRGNASQELTTFAAQCIRFRTGRIGTSKASGEIELGKHPGRHDNRGYTAVHLFPADAFAKDFSCLLDKIISSDVILEKLSVWANRHRDGYLYDDDQLNRLPSNIFTNRYNADGIEFCTDKPRYKYVQVWNNGVAEAVDFHAHYWGIEGYEFEGNIINLLVAMVSALELMSASLPVSVCITIKIRRSSVELRYEQPTPAKFRRLEAILKEAPNIEPGRDFLARGKAYMQWREALIKREGDIYWEYEKFVKERSNKRIKWSTIRNDDDIISMPVITLNNWQTDLGSTLLPCFNYLARAGGLAKTPVSPQ